jgi:RHS repeat-associated protein
MIFSSLNRLRFMGLPPSSIQRWKIQVHNGPDSGGKVTFATYAYDAFGRRIAKDVDDGAGGREVTAYAYDGPDILMEFDGTGGFLARYADGDLVDQPLAMTRGGQSYYIQADHQGSVIRVTDAAGAAVNSYAYDAYGQRLSATEGVEIAYGYTGREYDAESGLMFYRARTYDPATGRFLQTPVNSVDPNGAFKITVGFQGSFFPGSVGGTGGASVSLDVTNSEIGGSVNGQVGAGAKIGGTLIIDIDLFPDPIGTRRCFVGKADVEAAVALNLVLLSAKSDVGIEATSDLTANEPNLKVTPDFKISPDYTGITLKDAGSGKFKFRPGFKLGASAQVGATLSGNLSLPELAGMVPPIPDSGCDCP